jgi:hypothetical protein
MARDFFDVLRGNSISEEIEDNLQIDSDLEFQNEDEESEFEPLDANLIFSDEDEEYYDDTVPTFFRGGDYPSEFHGDPGMYDHR